MISLWSFRQVELVRCQPCSDVFGTDFLPHGMAVGGGVAKRYRVTLTADEREALGRMISRGKCGHA